MFSNSRIIFTQRLIKLPCALIFSTAIQNTALCCMDHEQPLKVINFDCDEAIASEQQMQDVMTEFDLSLLDM